MTRREKRVSQAIVNSGATACVVALCTLLAGWMAPPAVERACGSADSGVSQSVAPGQGGDVLSSTRLLAQEAPKHDDAAEEKARTRREAFIPKDVFERFFVIEVEGQRVGHARVSVEEWHHGATLVTRFEEWWFPSPQAVNGYGYWELQRHSETGPRAVAWWGSMADRERAGKFRLSGSWIERNWLGDAGDRMQLAVPSNAKYYQALAKRLASADASHAEFDWPVLNWHPIKPVWTKRSFAFRGEDTVRDTNGEEHAARRYRYWQDDDRNRFVELWVDDRGMPLGKRVSFLRLEYVLCDKATAEAEDKELPLAEAVGRWNLVNDGWILEGLYQHFAKKGEEAVPTSGTSEGDGSGDAAGSKEPAASQGLPKPWPEELMIDFGL
jgi:hypothetical protein